MHHVINGLKNSFSGIKVTYQEEIIQNRHSDCIG